MDVVFAELAKEYPVTQFLRVRLLLESLYQGPLAQVSV